MQSCTVILFLDGFFEKLRSCGSRKITLSSGRMYVAVRSDGTVMESEVNNTKTILTVELLSGDRIALKSYYGTYLATESNMANRWRQVVGVKATSKEISTTETFHVIDKSKVYPMIALINCNRYLAWAGDEGPDITAARTIGSNGGIWKWFFPECVGNMT